MSSSPIRSFELLHHHLAQLPSRCRVAVAHPADAHTLQAVLNAVHLGFVEAFLVGECPGRIHHIWRSGGGVRHLPS